MGKISVNIENLETALTNFVYASKEAQEINYRLKLLGNELVEDPDLLASPHYERIMSCYTGASIAIHQLNDAFDSLLPAAADIPEMYYNTESRSVAGIKSLVLNTGNLQKDGADTAELDLIFKKINGENVDVKEMSDTGSDSSEKAAAAHDSLHD
ncbi:MAG: hypothetical protein PUF31_01885 [Oscillospiraceae bacterium]|nr:hypothetical protein [Oscillospiraceae bacterium]